MLFRSGHTIAKEASNERGTISTYDGIVLAESIEGEDGKFVRQYPAGNLASHIVGYYSEKFGTSGIEASMNETLKGSQNYASWTDVINSLAGISSPGNDVTLTINSKIQEAAQNALEGYSGACVAIDPQTGAVLALASSPTYNAQDIDSIMKEAAEATSGESSVLLNRATQALYSPGSTFKIVTLSSALKDGITTEDSVYESPASMDIGNAPVTNVHDKNFGDITVERAFEVSSNVVFGQIGVELGAERLVGGANAFGFDSNVDFELPVKSSLMPAPAEMTTWETAWAASGEPVGEHESPAGPQATVLEMALVGCAIANDGNIMDPYLVEGVYNASGERSFSADPTRWKQATDAATASRVLECMKGVVKEGTGTLASVPGTVIAGKTGTAENEGRASNSWFVGIMNADSSKNVVIALMLEEAGEETSAAYRVKNVFQTALSVAGGQ